MTYHHAGTIEYEEAGLSVAYKSPRHVPWPSVPILDAIAIIIHRVVIVAPAYGIGQSHYTKKKFGQNCYGM